MTSERDPSALTELRTIRDWLRYGVSRFRDAGLVFGHGTTNAQDEAAFLILAMLKLPIDTLEPWLDARLTLEERSRIADILELRISTRKPASYLVNEAWIGAHRFYVDERTIVPRSFIGELLAGDLEGIVENPGEVRRVLDLCTGSGCLAILAALTFPNAEVVASDISMDALEVAAINVADYGLRDRVSLVRSDLFERLGEGKFDLIICNPPYVTDDAVAAFPAEYRAEPRLAHAGGSDGLGIVRRILEQAGERLADDGTLLVEIGMGREALESERAELPFLWLDTELSSGEVFVLPARALKRGVPAPPKGSSKQKAPSRRRT